MAGSDQQWQKGAAMTTGILLLGRDDVIESRAKRYKVALEFGETWALPFEKTLITRPGTAIPWLLLPAAWGILDKWDAAVPLWEYTKTAVSIGSAYEREFTQIAIRDLRVLLHSIELLFVRRNEAGVALLETFQTETDQEQCDEPRLAFLRALYQVKPRLCVLPTSWIRGQQIPVTAQPSGAPRRKIKAVEPGKPLVRVDLGDGRFVKCHAGDESTVMQMFSSDRRHDDMATINKKSFLIDNQQTRAKKGPLVRVELQPGRFVKMYEADAITQGYIKPKPEKKSRPAQADKRRPPQEDKEKSKPAPPVEEVPQPTDNMLEPVAAEATAADKLTEITGIGKATERLINAHGITTFDQLRSAEDLSFLSTQAQQSVEDWING
jgi:predicted flap endonuclease-1-like 5' DNA nuclease